MPLWLLPVSSIVRYEAKGGSSLFESIRNSPAKSRIIEEKLYEQVVNELAQGLIREGLWAKALANSEGSEQSAKALYMKYRVQSIKDEVRVIAEISGKQERSSEEKQRIEEPQNESLDILPNIIFFLGFGLLLLSAWLMLFH